MERSCREWPPELKWAATDFSRRRCLIFNRLSFIGMWSEFSIFPTYICTFDHIDHIGCFTVCQGFDWTRFPSHRALKPFYWFDVITHLTTCLLAPGIPATVRQHTCGCQHAIQWEGFSRCDNCVDGTTATTQILIEWNSLYSRNSKEQATTLHLQNL